MSFVFFCLDFWKLLKQEKSLAAATHWIEKVCFFCINKSKENGTSTKLRKGTEHRVVHQGQSILFSSIHTLSQLHVTSHSTCICLCLRSCCPESKKAGKQISHFFNQFSTLWISREMFVSESQSEDNSDGCHAACGWCWRVWSPAEGHSRLLSVSSDWLGVIITRPEEARSTESDWPQARTRHTHFSPANVQRQLSESLVKA